MPKVESKVKGETEEVREPVVHKTKRQLRLEEKRKRRVAPGIPSKKLDYPARPGFVRRVVTDREGRLEQFEQGGWDYVTKDSLHAKDEPDEHVSTTGDLGSRVSRVVGKHQDGSPMRGYLMEIEEELYNEDQAMKQGKLDELEDGLRVGELQGGLEKQDRGYVKAETRIGRR